MGFPKAIQKAQRVGGAFVLGAAAMLFAGLSFAAEGPVLPPAEYKPLPVGTTVKYDDRSYKITRTDGFLTVFKPMTGRQRAWLSTYALFGEFADDLHVSQSRGDAIEYEIDSDSEKKLESLWPIKVGNQVTFELHQLAAFNIPPEIWTITLKVLKTEVINLNGYSYETYVIEEKAETDDIPPMSFVGRKWYHPAAGLVIKAERTWTSTPTRVHFDSASPHFEKGEEDSYSLVKVTFPKGTTTHALKGAEVEKGADKTLLAEVERLKAALAARGQAGGTGVALPDMGVTGIEFGNYHALVIGIEDYKYLPKLETAVNDAVAVARILKKIYGFKVTLLLDPDHGEVIDAFDEYREKLGPKDNLLIYYAGHGWLDEDSDRGYWLPADAKPKRRSRWVSNATVTDTLKALSAKHVMVVADSCYSGSLVRGTEMGTRKRTGDYWKKMAGKWARVVITSGGLEPVADKGGGGHSPFAKAFIDALRENESIMDGTQMFSRMRRPVMIASDQTPQYSDVRKAGHDGGDFLFVRKR